MADYSPEEVFRIPGQLFLGVTDLSDTTDYGGTAVGFFENGDLVVSEECEAVISEAKGKRVAELCSETIVGFEMDLVQFDLDMLKKPWAFSGTTLLEPGLGRTRAPGYQTAGSPCLLVPHDTLLHPALLIYAPIFRHGRKSIPHGTMDKKRRERIYIDAIDDSAGRAFACDLVANLSL